MTTVEPLKFGHRHVAALWVLGALLMLAGCSGSGHRDLEKYVASVKERPAGRIPPIPEFRTYDSYAYDAFDMRDPFTAPLGAEQLARVDNGLRPPVDRHKEPLEQFPLDTLKFAGHLERKGDTWAIITAPDGLVHRIQRGNHLGQNYGKVINVTETALDIVEIIPDGIGGWIERQAALSIETQ